jgi:ABC-type multidrug transport system fused ATPase/permease subunit
MEKVQKLGSAFKSVRKCLDLVEVSVRRRLAQLIAVQVALSLADLFGVALVGLVGALAFSGILGQDPNPILLSILELLNISGRPFNQQVVILSLLALLILTFRSILTMYLSSRVLKYLSKIAANLTIRLFKKLTGLHPSYSSKFSRQDVILAITNGPQTIILGVIAIGVTLIADLFLSFGMLLFLFLVEPLTAMITFLIFVLAAIVIHKRSQRGITRFSELETSLNMSVNRNIEETLRMIKELHLINRKSHKLSELAASRIRASEATAILQFTPSISKYLMETLIVLGGFIVGGFQLLITDLTSAAATFGIFIVSSSRIAPAIMRIQQNIGILNSNLGRVTPYREIIDFIEDSKELSDLPTDGFYKFSDEDLELRVKGLSFKYQDSNTFVIRDFNLSLAGKGLIGLVGESGSGKSTLLKLLLGLEFPSQGSVMINEIEPNLLHVMNPGFIASVPQEIQLIKGTLRENVAFGLEASKIDDSLVFQVLEDVGLNKVLKIREIGLGEQLTSLSGGQKQRLGLARALYLKPKILILDEPTASLDSVSEGQIIDVLLGLRTRMLIILVTHKFENLSNAERVVFLQNGKIEADGLPAEVLKNFYK